MLLLDVWMSEIINYVVVHTTCGDWLFPNLANLIGRLLLEELCLPLGRTVDEPVGVQARD